MPHTSPSQLPQRLKARRLARHLSQRELANLTDIKKENISRLEVGRFQYPRADTLMVLAIALDCTTDYLLGLNAYPYPYTPTEEYRDA